MAIVHRSEYYELTRVSTGRYRLVRTAEAFGPMDAVRVAVEPLLEILEARRPRALLVDLRQAPGRNDPDFEAAFAPLRARMSRAAERTALLTRTHVGKLQVERLAREDGAQLVLFHEVGAAERWLALSGP